MHTHMRPRRTMAATLVPITTASFATSGSIVRVGVDVGIETMVGDENKRDGEAE